MHSSAWGAAERISLRSFSSAARLSSLNGARYSSMVRGFAGMARPPREIDALRRRALTPRVLGMKGDLGSPRRRPPNRFGIAPALVANRDSERDPVDLEEPPGVSRHVEPILGRVELVLGLASQNPAVGVDDDGRDL